MRFNFFSSLVGIPKGITSSTGVLKVCGITTEIKGTENLLPCDIKKNILYFNIYKQIVLYLFKFIKKLYQFKNFSHNLFFFHLAFYIYLNKIYYAEQINDVFDSLQNVRMQNCICLILRILLQIICFAK